MNRTERMGEMLRSHRKAKPWAAPAFELWVSRFLVRCVNRALHYHTASSFGISYLSYECSEVPRVHLELWLACLTGSRETPGRNCAKVLSFTGFVAFVPFGLHVSLIYVFPLGTADTQFFSLIFDSIWEVRNTYGWFVWSQTVGSIRTYYFKCLYVAACTARKMTLCALNAFSFQEIEPERGGEGRQDFDDGRFALHFKLLATDPELGR